MLSWIKEYLSIKQSGRFNPEEYLRAYPDVRAADIGPLMHYIIKGREEGRQLFQHDEPSSSPAAQSLHDPVNLLSQLNEQLDITRVPKEQVTVYNPEFPGNFNLEPLRVFTELRSKRRINLVTDSINSGSLFGGVATGIILAVLIARKWHCDLRIITRTEIPKTNNFPTILQANNLDFDSDVDFVFANCMDPDSKVAVGEEEYFLTTSWWTTYSVLKSIPPQQIIYLLQEDERNFYPFDDTRLLCEKTLSNAEIRFLINTELLFESFIADGFNNIAARGEWFEPAFPKSLFYFEKPSEEKTKKHLIFYARPNNVRNLYQLGLRTINSAIRDRLINLEKWQIHFVGKDLSPTLLTDGVSPLLHQNLAWTDYAATIRKADLGLSLMYSPHPSYPPLDLAASGAIVLTNKYKNKTSLEKYSRNIICAELDEIDLLHKFAVAVELSEDGSKRSEQYSQNTINRDWETSFKKIVEDLG